MKNVSKLFRVMLMAMIAIISFAALAVAYEAAMPIWTIIVLVFVTVVLTVSTGELVKLYSRA